MKLTTILTINSHEAEQSGYSFCANHYIHPIPDIWATFVQAKMVHISEKSIKQKAI